MDNMLYIWPFFASTVIIIILIGMSWNKSHLPIGRSFIVLFTLTLFWTSCFIMELSMKGLGEKLFWVKLQFIAIPFIPIAMLYLVVSYIGRKYSIEKWLLLSLVPIVVNIFIWLIPTPNLFWGQAELVRGRGGFMVVDYNYGPLFYFVHVPYGYLIMLAVITKLLQKYKTAYSVYRRQIITVMMALVLPTITDMLYVIGYSPRAGVNYTTAVFGISCLIITKALYKYDFLELLPMARDIVIESMEDGLIVLDSKNRVVDVNPSGMHISGMEPCNIGCHISEILSGSIYDAIQDINAGGKKHSEIKISKSSCDSSLSWRNGSQVLNIKYYDVHFSNINDSNGKIQGGIVTLRDNTERALLFQQIKEQAIRDSLTGIYNRRHFFELGSMEIEKVKRNPSEPLSAIMIDMDDFKNVNDTYGHSVGDQLLTEFTNLCLACLRGYDIFGRIGGDEFAILLPNTNFVGAGKVAKRIKENIIDARFSTPVGNVSISASFGFASTEQEMDEGIRNISLEQLLNRSDMHMYESKRKDDNQTA